MLSSAEHKIFSANKYENANNSWHFHIYKQINLYDQLCFSKKESEIVSNLIFITKTNLMLKLYNLGARNGKKCVALFSNGLLLMGEFAPQLFIV